MEKTSIKKQDIEQYTKLDPAISLSANNSQQKKVNINIKNILYKYS